MKTVKQNVREFQLRGRPPKYDWDELFDGQTWVLEAGKDYPRTSSARSIRSSVYSAAHRRGVRVVTSIIDGVLHLQRIDMEV